VVRQGCDQAESSERPQPADSQAQHSLHVQGRRAQETTPPGQKLNPAVAKRPVLVLTQGDPAGVGPELLLKLLAGEDVGRDWRPLVVAERAALQAVRDVVPEASWRRLSFRNAQAEISFEASDSIVVVDPVGRDRKVSPGVPTNADAKGAIAALDLGIRWARDRPEAALVTAPLNKAVVARHLLPDFRGHTEYLAAAAGLETYGRDYLMTFLAPDMRVALLSMHLPLTEAVASVSQEAILEALRCLWLHAPGRLAVAGLNPHAGEGGLLGQEEESTIRPAVERARSQGIDVVGPESPDSVFVRCRRGEFDWVLALYHDQGLIAVKTAAFGSATNWTLGLPYLRTSVDHGTAYDIAGSGVADPGPIKAVVETTLRLMAERRTVASLA